MMEKLASCALSFFRVLLKKRINQLWLCLIKKIPQSHKTNDFFILFE